MDFIYKLVLLHGSQQSSYSACMRLVISASFTPSTNPKRIASRLSSLVQIDNLAAMLKACYTPTTMRDEERQVA
ncbi:hypothetical protein TNCV_4334661 [Trichonephila clavipes]|nr:hypothetical protein TNCV_4334661 [Trichonephila clavipes]